MRSSFYSCQCKPQISYLLGNLQHFLSVMSPMHNTFLLFYLWFLCLGSVPFLIYICLILQILLFDPWRAWQKSSPSPAPEPNTPNQIASPSSYTEFLQSFYTGFLCFPSKLPGLRQTMLQLGNCLGMERHCPLLAFFFMTLQTLPEFSASFYKHRPTELLVCALGWRWAWNELSLLVCSLVLTLAEFIVMWTDGES